MVHYKNSFGETAYKDSSCTEIINTSKPFEDNIKAVWSRNVFFILWYGLIYNYFFIAALINRVIRGVKYLYKKITKKSYVYSRKVSQNRLIELHHLIVESNIWVTIWFMILFYSIGIAKLIYHIAKITAWLVKHVGVPIVLWLTAIFAIISFSGAIASKNQNQHRV